MLRSLPTTITLTAACLAAAVGCYKEPPPLPSAAKLTPARRPSVAITEEPLIDRDAAPPLAEWTPPYASREDLFAPPQRSRAAARQSSGDDESVELIGFVSVDEPRAVLSIDGVIASVAAGAQKYGIQVISIAPPEVVLQRGRTRWTASLR